MSKTYQSPYFYGFLLGLVVAFTSAAKPALQIGDFPDTSWLFFAGAVFSALCVYLWKASAQSAEESLTEVASSSDALQVLRESRQLIEVLTILKGKIDTLEFSQIEAQIDAALIAHINPIVDHQQSILSRLGMSSGAQFLIDLAKGERMLNRVVTAALDEHRPEVMASLAEALDAVINAFNGLENRSI